MLRIRSWTICLLLPLSLLAAKPAKKPDSSAVFALLKEGVEFTAAAAKDAEKSLESNPDDSAMRIKLLSYYAGVTEPAAAVEAARAARVGHILWVIEHDPVDGYGLFHVTSGVHLMHCQGDALADVNGTNRVGRAWIAQLKKYPKEEEVFRQTVASLQYCAPTVAEQLFTSKGDYSGLGGLYAEAVLGITGNSYKENEAEGSSAALRETPFAKHAFEVLDQATNADMLEGAALTMLGTGARLWADGKLDWDYTPFGTKLLAAARAEGAHNMRFHTLMTTLPQRGERPPVMLRIGGNLQAKNLVKKVTPRYPEEAKHRMIAGTVRMKALLGLDGRVLDLEVVSGPKELVAASVDAARQWLYKPTLLNGKPVYVLTLLDINYDIR